jgi:hypothetical protein
MSESRPSRTNTPISQLEPARRESARIANRQYMREYRSLHAEDERTKWAEYVERNRVKKSAWDKIRYALSSGATTKPECCERCGAKRWLSALIKDYSDPLCDLEFVCQVCRFKVMPQHIGHRRSVQ